MNIIVKCFFLIPLKKISIFAPQFKKMAEENKDQPIVDIGEAYSKTEHFIEENKKTISIAVGVIIAVVGIYFAWQYWFVAGREADAQKDMFMAEMYFQKDSFNLAINGDGTNKGLQEIVDNYSFTPSANLAEYYLGISYLRKGEFENAIEHLENFDSDDQILGPIAIGATGDANMELGKTDAAIKKYLAAAEKNHNTFTSPIYLKKAGMAYEAAGNNAEAAKVYELIKADYSKSNEASDIDKYIERAKTKSGQ
jgi:tetratricopeptide (TPR) repeat protein